MQILQTSPIKTNFYIPKFFQSSTFDLDLYRTPQWKTCKRKEQGLPCSGAQRPGPSRGDSENDQQMHEFITGEQWNMSIITSIPEFVYVPFLYRTEWNPWVCECVSLIPSSTDLSNWSKSFLCNLAWTPGRIPLPKGISNAENQRACTFKLLLFGETLNDFRCIPDWSRKL